MHLKTVKIDTAKYPVRDRYPFDLPIFQTSSRIELDSPMTFFLGENGAGKSTLLKAICHRCGIHIWKYSERSRFELNPYEERFYQAVYVEWSNGTVPGSFFSSQTFQDFVQIVDEWASSDSRVLEYFGGKSLMTQSHGQSLMSYFSSRYTRKGIYLMDEPETSLSPKSQLALLRVIHSMSQAGHAQFIIATHSPILLSCPDSDIFCFDTLPIRKIAYEATDHFRIYKDFMVNQERYFQDK
ncbi:MAG: AAA family ATPase [Thermodesulfovibrionales bacterium]|nr:AAA family ATPase [Thermodesulfovibrionales bacterium]